MPKLIIAIDGYSGCGKSTTAREVAKIFKYRYIDTGAMYRAVTLYFLDNHISLTNPKEVAKALASIKVSFRTNKAGFSETFLNNINVESEIREMRVAEHVSEVSALAPVRKAMVEQQRKMGNERAVVMDGRDIGTVVFPNADLKMFLTANIKVRAFRRQQELLKKNELVDLQTIISNLQKRDHIDSTRKESPLVQAPDSILLDTSYLTIVEEVDEVVRMAIEKLMPYWAAKARKKNHKQTESNI